MFGEISSRSSHRAITCTALLLLAAAPLLSQEIPGQGLPTLLRGNEQFGRKLLERVHSAAPDRNVVVSPLSLTIVLAAIQNDSGQGLVRREIGEAFGWGDYPRLSVPARMLLAAFEKPEPNRQASRRAIVGHRPSPEGAWITNIVLYRLDRGRNVLSERFVSDAQHDFGLKFESTGAKRPTAADLSSVHESSSPVPTVSPRNDVWISSGTHIQTAWRGNTFSMSAPHQGSFRTASGEVKQVEVLDSELASFPYAKTDTFEAVALPCNDGYMLAVLPMPGRNLSSLERELAEEPEAVDNALKNQPGIVTMPTFRIRFNADLREHIEEIGIKEVFRDLGPLIKIKKSHLTQVAQDTEIQVDNNGIRANAETVVGAIYGGIGSARDYFHMELNRPFLFFVRDRNTNALLFLGAVVDPSQE